MRRSFEGREEGGIGSSKKESVVRERGEESMESGYVAGAGVVVVVVVGVAAMVVVGGGGWG